MKIAKTAIVDPKAELADDVVVGPYSIIGPNVRIGEGTVIGSRVTIEGNTEIGRNNRIHDGAVLGSPPQDLKFKGEPTKLIIGDGNTIREYVTMNVGTEGGGGVTKVGNDNHFMACAHVAHDCLLEDRIIMANSVLLGGHVVVQTGAVFGGLAAIHHYARIGRIALVGGLTRVVHDVPPFMIVEGRQQIPCGVNIIGCKRNGIDGEDLRALKRAYKLLYHSNLTVSRALQKLEEENTELPELKLLIQFLKEKAQSRTGRYRELFRPDRIVEQRWERPE